MGSEGGGGDGVSGEGGADGGGTEGLGSTQNVSLRRVEPSASTVMVSPGRSPIPSVFIW